MQRGWFKLGRWVAAIGTTLTTATLPAQSLPPTAAPPHLLAQNDGSQAAQTRIADLGVSDAQLQKMQALGMKIVMPKNVPTGYQLMDIITREDSRFKGYLLVYRKGSSCFAVEGTSGGIGGIPAGDRTAAARNAVLGRGNIELYTTGTNPQLVGQWMGRGPFYRVVGANYNFNGGNELAGCQNISLKDAVFVAEALRYIDLERQVLQPTPVTDANSPTSTVVRYPSDKELTQFKQNLKSGTFGQSVALSPQQQAYRATWAKLNPTGAKFAGAWTAGDRTYYVYPSKVKSRVCVVTREGNGKLEFSNGQAISRELRYRDNGLYWIDQANVLAAREGGTGQLYPLFVANSAPTPAELTDFNYGFNSAECTMDLSAP